MLWQPTRGILQPNQHWRRGQVSVASVFSNAMNLDNDGWDGYTLRQSLLIAALTVPAFTPAQIRVTFEASSVEGWTIGSAYIGHAAGSGDAYDFAATPVQLLFSGSGSKAISAGAQAVTDWASFAWDKTSGLVISSYSNGGSSADRIRSRSGGISNVQGYYKLGSDVTTVNATGYTADHALIGIANIEVQ